jgi:Xaa-Pro dipeptidase
MIDEVGEPGTATEAERKRSAALDVAGPFVTDDPADIRWLLCGRGKPVSAESSPYAVVVDDGRPRVLFQNIEASRIAAEERWEELGYEAVPYDWFEPLPEATTSPDLGAVRRALGNEELERYREAGADVAAAFVDVIRSLHPELRELDVAADLAGRLHALAFTTPVLLAGGEARARVHRHPLPTEAPLGEQALVAVTAERHGLHVSMTRIVSFGRPPRELVAVVAAAAAVDAAVLEASRPGRTVAELFDVLARTYAELGYPEEWRKHHQGGMTGYRGREIFATPGDETVLPSACAVAWNPTVTGGGKSEDTALVTAAGIDVVTETPELPEVDGRPAIVVL